MKEIKVLHDSREAARTPLTRIQASVDAARSICEQPLVPGKTGIIFKGFLRTAIEAAREIVCDNPLQRSGEPGYPSASQGLDFLRERQPGFTDTFARNLNEVVEEIDQKEKILINR